MYEQEDVIVLWNQGVHTEREFTTNRPDVITRRQKCRAKGSGKEAKIQEFMVMISPKPDLLPH
jgi:hypothetical protein